MRPTWLSLAILALMSPHRTPAPSVEILVAAADPTLTGTVDIAAIAGHPRLMAADSAGLTDEGTRAVLPVRLALTEGAELALRGHDGVALRVPGDSFALRSWQITGSILRLRYVAQADGRLRLVILEAESGRLVMGQPRRPQNPLPPPNRR